MAATAILCASVARAHTGQTRRSTSAATSASTRSSTSSRSPPKPMPLVTLLDEAPRRVASMLDAEVCSLYLVEGSEGELVMRGNVGLRTAAIGQVRLRVGEGITGETPSSTCAPSRPAVAESHAAYKHFAELGEERFPVFLAVPIRGKAGRSARWSSSARERPFDVPRRRTPERDRRSYRRGHPQRRAR